MHISLNTAEEISDLDRQVLALLAGVVTKAAPPAPPEKPAVVKAKPAPKKAKPEPEPTPEPMAEEPVEEPEVEEVEDDAETSDEDLLALAVKKATEMVAGGDAAKVREALDAAGASRVRELNKDNVREFFKALS